MAYYSEKIYELEISNEVSKQAYLDCCKWLAKHVYNNESLTKYITTKIEKQKNKKKPTFKVILFVTMDDKELKEDFCKKCKQLNSIFYCVEKPSCDNCKFRAYKKKIEYEFRGIKDFAVEVIEKHEEE